MSKRVVVYREDGGVSILIPDPKCRKLQETEEEWFNGCLMKMLSAQFDSKGNQVNICHGMPFEVIKILEVPLDRTFRDAWTKCPVNKIKVDMPKARKIHMDRIRVIRDKRLSELDIEWQKAIEKDDKAKAKIVADSKQILRDLPETFDLEIAKTPEDLKKLIPTELMIDSLEVV